MAVRENGFSMQEIDDTVSELKKLNLTKADAFLRIGMELTDHISWRDLFDIYQRALDVDRGKLSTSIYAIWLQSTFNLLLKTDSSEYQEIFDKSVEIHQRAFTYDPDNCGFALSFGLLYFKYSKDLKRVDEAVKWFKTSEELSVRQKDLTVQNWSSIYLGYCYFALKKWKQTINCLERVDPIYFNDDEDEFSPKAKDKILKKSKEMLSSI